MAMISRAPMINIFQVFWRPRAVNENLLDLTGDMALDLGRLFNLWNIHEIQMWKDLR